MSIFIGADHRGFELKQKLIDSFISLNLVDLGADRIDSTDDYNDFAIKVAKAVLADPGSTGILICGSAQGMTMQANRFKGIRAAYCSTVDDAEHSRRHNDANILCLSADLTINTPEDILNKFLETNFIPEARYIRRNNKLDEDY